MRQALFFHTLLPAVLVCTLATGALAKDAYPPVEVLLSGSETIIGQKLVYPAGQAQITAAIVNMPPGKSTGPHIHNVPLFGYMLEGELTVDYGPDGTRTYRKGDSLLEAVGSIHNGTNTGTGLARVLVVFAGAEGVKNTETGGE